METRKVHALPLPRTMQEADEIGYLPHVGAWEGIETEFISDNEMILHAISTVAVNEGSDHLPSIKVPFTAHFTFGEIEPTESYEHWHARAKRLEANADESKE